MRTRFYLCIKEKRDPALNGGFNAVSQVALWQKLEVASIPSMRIAAGVVRPAGSNAPLSRASGVLPW
jgi:hypothetical protein